MASSYQTRIQTDCGCIAEEAVYIEQVMRTFVLHSTLDWLSAAQFRAAARKAGRLYHAEKAMFDAYFAGIRTQFHNSRQAQA